MAATDRELRLIVYRWRETLPLLKLAAEARSRGRASAGSAVELGSRVSVARQLPDDANEPIEIPDDEYMLAKPGLVVIAPEQRAIRGNRLAEELAQSLETLLADLTIPVPSGDAPAEAMLCWAMHLSRGWSIRRVGRVLSGSEPSDARLIDNPWPRGAPEQRARERMWMSAASPMWRRQVTLESAEGIRKILAATDEVLLTGRPHALDGRVAAEESLEQLLQRVGEVNPRHAADLRERSAVSAGRVRIPMRLDLTGCGRVLLPDSIRAAELVLDDEVSLYCGRSLDIERDLLTNGAEVVRWPDRLNVGRHLDLSEGWPVTSWPSERFEVGGNLDLRDTDVAALPSGWFAVAGSILVLDEDEEVEARLRQCEMENILRMTEGSNAATTDTESGSSDHEIGWESEAAKRLGLRWR